ncbi:MAG: DegT/DnrJ/EryC1/StrS family aminotransferase, partial [Spirochaetales bacterium]|nr:DegT/DnrJ/EryC1/StrS family aminotransferase [Spirochaetales bacterium]
MSNTLAINGGSKAINLDQKIALQWPVLTEEDEQAVLGVIRRNETSMSDEPLKLEKEFAEYLGAKYALAEINGTSALYAALFVLGIGPGDEVICPSYTYWASAMPAATLGAKVIFCEVYPDSLDLDVD